MNAGYIPKEHWVHDINIGGGRVIGEACHLVDLCIYLTGSLVQSVLMSGLGENFDSETDNVSILLKFQNGSNASLNYFSNGSKKYSKERVEVYCSGKTWITDNYARTICYGSKSFKNLKTKVDKGYINQFMKFFNLKEIKVYQIHHSRRIFNASKTAILAVESMKVKKWITI